MGMKVRNTTPAKTVAYLSLMPLSSFVHPHTISPSTYSRCLPELLPMGAAGLPHPEEHINDSSALMQRDHLNPVSRFFPICTVVTLRIIYIPVQGKWAYNLKLLALSNLRQSS